MAGFGAGRQFSGFTDPGFQGSRQGFMPSGGNVDSTQIQQGTQQYNNARNLAEQQYGFQSGLQSQNFAGQGALQAGQLASQQAIASQAQAGETQRANIAANAAMFPSQVKQGEFNQIFPLVSGEMGFLNGQIGSQGGQNGGPNGADYSGQPNITQGGVFNDRQIQQQVNAARAQTDASAANQQRQNAGNLAARGFANNSPLLQLLNQNANMQAMSTNADTERQTRLGAAQANASQRLQSQQAAEQQYAARQQEANQRLASRSSVLSALVGSV